MCKNKGRLMNNKFDKMGEYNQIRYAKQNAQIMTIHKTMTNLVMDTSTVGEVSFW